MLSYRSTYLPLLRFAQTKNSELNGGVSSTACHPPSKCCFQGGAENAGVDNFRGVLGTESSLNAAISATELTSLQYIKHTIFHALRRTKKKVVGLARLLYAIRMSVILAFSYSFVYMHHRYSSILVIF